MPPAQYPVHALLAPHVECIWVAERRFAPPHNTFDILPDSYVELIFHFGAAAQLETGAGWRELGPVYIVGLLQRPAQLRADGLVQTLAVRCRAWGVRPLLGDLPEFDGPLLQLHARLAVNVARGATGAAVAELEAFLLDRALTATVAPGVVAAAALLTAEQGAARIAAIADRCAISPRQLERTFQRAVGVTPKALARTLRFQQVRDRLWREPDADLATLAYEYGYADQAHLSCDFRRFSDRTPRQFAAEMRATQALLRASDVAIVQDT